MQDVAWCGPKPITNHQASRLVEFSRLRIKSRTAHTGRRSFSAFIEFCRRASRRPSPAGQCARRTLGWLAQVSREQATGHFGETFSSFLLSKRLAVSQPETDFWYSQKQKFIWFILAEDTEETQSLRRVTGASEMSSETGLGKGAVAEFLSTVFNCGDR